MPPMKEFDIVVFGASGLTGRYITEQLYKSSQDNIKWAVAGRDESKVRSALEEVSSWVESDLSGSAVIVADVYQPETLDAMAARTHCIINTVGPYTLWGEPVIKACLEHGTHLLDLSGELHFNESMRNKYHKEALDKNVVILATAGFDSIPSELILQYAKQHFPGKLNSLETYVTFKDGEHGGVINTGTWNSIIQINKHLGEVAAIRANAWKTIFQQPWQQVAFRIPRSLRIRSRSEIPGYSIPFIAGDKPVLSHAEFFRREIDPDYQRTQIQTNLYTPTFCEIFVLCIAFGIMGLLSQFGFGRRFLRRYPHIVTFGKVKKGGPTRLQALTCSFTTFGIGTGWASNESKDKKPQHKIVVQLDGPEVAYITTAACITQSAICLLRESQCLPMKGGYLTPGFALEKSSLMKRLIQNGFKFTVVENKLADGEKQ